MGRRANRTTQATTTNVTSCFLRLPTYQCYIIPYYIIPCHVVYTMLRCQAGCYQKQLWPEDHTRALPVEVTPTQCAVHAWPFNPCSIVMGQWYGRRDRITGPMSADPTFLPSLYSSSLLSVGEEDSHPWYCFCVCGGGTIMACITRDIYLVKPCTF